MTNTEMLRDTIKAKGLKYNYVAEQLGITPYALQKKSTMRTIFGQEKSTCLPLSLVCLARSVTKFFLRKIVIKYHYRVKRGEGGEKARCQNYQKSRSKI